MDADGQDELSDEERPRGGGERELPEDAEERHGYDEEDEDDENGDEEGFEIGRASCRERVSKQV